MCMPSLPRSCFDGLILSCMAPGCNCSELCFFSMDTQDQMETLEVCDRDFQTLLDQVCLTDVL